MSFNLRRCICRSKDKVFTWFSSFAWSSLQLPYLQVFLVSFFITICWCIFGCFFLHFLSSLQPPYLQVLYRTLSCIFGCFIYSFCFVFFIVIFHHDFSCIFCFRYSILLSSLQLQYLQVFHHALVVLFLWIWLSWF